MSILQAAASPPRPARASRPTHPSIVASSARDKGQRSPAASPPYGEYGKQAGRRCGGEGLMAVRGRHPLRLTGCALLAEGRRWVIGAIIIVAPVLCAQLGGDAAPSAGARPVDERACSAPMWASAHGGKGPGEGGTASPRFTLSSGGRSRRARRRVRVRSCQRTREGRLGSRPSAADARRQAARDDAAGAAERWAAVRVKLEAGRISRSEAARRLDCGYATVLWLLNGGDGACSSSASAV